MVRSSRRTYTTSTAVILGAVTAVVLAACGPRAVSRDVAEFDGPTMGTSYSVRIVLPEGYDSAALEPLPGTVQEIVDRIDQLMSPYKDDSEVSRFNAWQSTEPFPISPETAELVSLYQRISELTDGAFDITVAPLVEAWGFGPGKGEGRELSDEEVAALRERVDYRYIEVDEAALTLRKTRPDVTVDLTSAADGYAVDKVGEYLASLGYADYLVEVGGEVVTRGRNERGQPWRVAIERPVPNVRAVETMVPLSGEALSTSGDYRNFFVTEEGERFSHTLDARTGRPVRHKLASVSVIHRECAEADAWSTAILALGPEDGMELARREGLIVLMLLHTDEPGTFETRTSPAYDAFRQKAGGSDGADDEEARP